MKIRITYKALSVYMKSLIISFTKNTKRTAFVLIETSKVEAYQNDLPIGITKYHSPDAELDTIPMI